ncbi:FecR/PupR family sigma factor regulator [Roseateles sp. DC23W]|uniref:FecR/PupR family sigma factor regulator n=1 Tax=Pelomonas dachongensis TaxID=3299029 RepID=A0ABW7EVW1_9BURK
MSNIGFDRDDGQGSGRRQQVTPQIAAEAAVWVVSLHGPDRDGAMEEGLRAWLNLSPAHREAFEEMTDIWQAIPGTRTAQAYAAAIEASKRRARRRRYVALQWVALGVVAVCIGAVLVAL